jgi:L,D-transpeptidase ErfK/SrfK
MPHIFLPQRSWLPVLLLLVGLLSGCAEMTRAIRYDEQPPIDFGGEVESEPPKGPQATATLQGHNFHLNGKDSLVGRLATVSLHEGDTLLDIARHFGLGYQHIIDANPGLDIWVPQQGLRAVLPLQFTLPNAKRVGVVINTATMRLFYFKGAKQTELSTWPIGIGREGRSTPLGLMAIGRKMQHPTWYVPESIRRTHAEQGDPLPTVVPPGPDNPLGDFALYLTKPSYLIHGTNKPFSIGLRASNGCIRLYPEDIEHAFKEIPINTPVVIVNQPYLLGWLDGVLYLEAHEPYEEVNADAEIKNLKQELERIGKETQHKIDWPKVEETLKKRRGIPVPIFEHTPSLNEMLAAAPAWERPAQLFGQPEQAGPGKAGWFIHTEATDEYRAKKLAAQMNHFGPRIPAYTLATSRGHHVIGGPFTQEQAARKAQLALREDFSTKSEIIKPDKNYTPPKPIPTVVAKKADQATPIKPVKLDPNKPATAEPAKTTKPDTNKPDKAEPKQALDWIEQQKAKNPPKPVERKAPIITLKLPKTM